MKRWDMKAEVSWCETCGGYGAEMRAADEGEYLKRDEVLQELLKQFWKNDGYEGPQATDGIYFAIRALGYTKEEVFVNHSIRLPDNGEKSDG